MFATTPPPPPKKHVHMLVSCCTHREIHLLPHIKTTHRSTLAASGACSKALPNHAHAIAKQAARRVAQNMRGHTAYITSSRRRKKCIRAHPMIPKCALSVACGARKAGVSQPGRHPCRGVSVGEAGVEWGMCLYWVVRGWYPT